LKKQAFNCTELFLAKAITPSPTVAHLVQSKRVFGKNFLESGRESSYTLKNIIIKRGLYEKNSLSAHHLVVDHWFSVCQGF
jgi:hypothetical protein